MLPSGFSKCRFRKTEPFSILLKLQHQWWIMRYLFQTLQWETSNLVLLKEHKQNKFRKITIVNIGAEFLVPMCVLGKIYQK